MKYTTTYKPFGNAAILIEWPTKIEESIINDIINFEDKLNSTPEIIDTIITYNSLTIQYEYIEDFNQIVNQLKELYLIDNKQKKHPKKVWEIPVFYDVEFGLDLVEFAKVKDLSIEQVVKLHTKEPYMIYFLGFQPGFLYLGGLDEKLYMPRKATPRLRIQKGSVGIGGKQTGVYPSNNSGGWNIIGRSPIDFFNIENNPSCFAKAGDRIQFFSIDKNQYHQIEEEVNNGIYELKFHLF